MHVVSFIAAYLAIICLCLYKPTKSMPDEITWPVTIVLIIWAVISWFIMPLSVIINLEYWGGTLGEVAVLAGIGVDLCLKPRTAGILVETSQKNG